MNIIKLFIKQIKAHPVTVIFFMVGYFISTLILSIGFSNIVYMRNSIIERNNGIYKDSLNIYISSSKSINFDNIIDTFKDISKKSKIRITNLSSYIGNGNEELHIIAEYFKSDNGNFNFPIIKGRHYTAEEILKGEKVVLLGNDLEQHTFNDGDKQKIKIGLSEYTVIGFIGNKNKKSIWDKTVFMPITSIPENSKLNYFKSMTSSLLLISESQKEASDLQSLINNIKKIDPNSIVEASRTEESKNVFLNVLSQNAGIILISILLFGFSIINIVNISSFWINERKTEIAIRKSFGINNFQIFILLFMEFLSITLITTIISLVFQAGLSTAINSAFGYFLYVTKENFILSLIISILSALITVIVPSIKMMKISPIEALKI
ncbi:ABC transporter permease [Clostridium polynesiense]|uniref:ABC transporter permease n=1 Tax=Clostridium polynesiense TaxID=1325933 RepID=UPI00058F06C0|nr:ABC transporter permease [Clostridium polynesiense]